MENNNQRNQQDVIDLREAIKKLWSKRKMFLTVWIITFVLACVYILPQPRVYYSKIVLAPENSGQSVSGSLAGIASSFGLNLDGNAGTDAVYPELYPDLMGTNKFLVNLLHTHVKTVEGDEVTYLEYFRKFHRENPYFVPLSWCKGKISQLFEDNQGPATSGKGFDPKCLSYKENNLVDAARKSVTCDVDVKTNVITISAQAQDPMVCTILADSACKSLQAWITDYRTSKARIDADYYKHLLDSAATDYRKSVERYSDYCDHHQEAVLQAYVSKRDELENDMQNKLNTFNAIQTQYSMAKAKIQENTPAFTIMQDASVPVKPNGPKRMIFVAVMLFLATVVQSFYYLREELLA